MAEAGRGEAKEDEDAAVKKEAQCGRIQEVLLCGCEEETISESIKRVCTYCSTLDADEPVRVALV